MKNKIHTIDIKRIKNNEIKKTELTKIPNSPSIEVRKKAMSYVNKAIII